MEPKYGPVNPDLLDQLIEVTSGVPSSVRATGLVAEDNNQQQGGLDKDAVDKAVDAATTDFLNRTIAS